MEVKYDFHIHTALSPCALDEMTPNNIVNMALISEISVIAVTDHNTCGNIEAVITVAKDTGLVVIPGMEIETREEIHVICLFTTILNVYKMQEYVYRNLPKLKNKSKVLGHQFLLDSSDERVGEEERLLSFATDMTFEEVISTTWELGGIAIPAHIDRPSYSVISNLGMLPQNELLTCLEVSQYCEYNEYVTKFSDYTILQSSDSHELGIIGICNKTLDIELGENEKLSPKIIIDFLKKDKNQ